MKKEHTSAVNRYLLSCPITQKMYQNFTGTVYACSETYKAHGGLFLKNPRVVKAGCFGPGGEDLLGYTMTKVTQEMVGSIIPIFTTTEIKTKGDIIRPKQKKWLNIHRNDGCITKVVRYIGKACDELDF